MKWKNNLWSKIFSVLQKEEVKGVLHIVQVNLQKLWNHFFWRSWNVGDGFNVANLEGKTS